MTTTRCPSCGAKLVIQEAKTAYPMNAQSPSMKLFEHAAPFNHPMEPVRQPPVSGEWHAERITPIGRLEVKDVATSIFDAVASFSLITIAGAGICWYAGLPFVLAPSAGLATALWRYFSMINLAKSLLEKVETVVNHDIDNDGYVGPPPEPQTVRVELHSVGSDSSRWQFADLNVTPKKLQTFARSILHGNNSFSERTATTVGLTQAEFGHIREKFIDRGWAVWNHPSRRQQGVSLTRGGNFIFRQILSTPLPGAESPVNGLHVSTQQHAARKYEFIEGVK